MASVALSSVPDDQQPLDPSELKRAFNMFNEMSQQLTDSYAFLENKVEQLSGELATVSAQRMQELAPELKKIADQYKDDMEGRLKAQRDLQKRVGFNPMAGCLPMFLQLPIFIGLYRALSVDIELRQAAVSSSTARMR